VTTVPCLFSGSVSGFGFAEDTFETYFDAPLENVMEATEYTATDMDIVSSMGERLSNFIIAQYIRSVAGDEAAVYIPGDEVVVTDGVPGNSAPLLGPTKERMNEIVRPRVERGTIPMVTGFFGASQDGLLTTFGRGGSDLTAALVGYALDADEVALYKVEYTKDDEGFLLEWTSGWEGIVHDADVSTTIPSVTYQVAAELAHFGKKVLHPSTVAPAVEKAIDLRVLNSLNHEHPGTTIGAFVSEAVAATQNAAGEVAEESPALLSDSESENVVSTITKTRLSDYELKHNRNFRLLKSDGSEWDHDSSQSTLIAMVGLDIMKHKMQLLARIEADLAAAGIEHAVPDTVNGSSHNLSIVVPAKSTKDTLRILHTELVLNIHSDESDHSSDGLSRQQVAAAAAAAAAASAGQPEIRV
jgi:aspartokinase